MKISDLLDKGAIITNLRSRDKKGALEEMVKALVKAGRIREVDVALSPLLDREAVDITAFGQGVAFPMRG